MKELVGSIQLPFPLTLAQLPFLLQLTFNIAFHICSSYEPCPVPTFCLAVKGNPSFLFQRQKTQVDPPHHHTGSNPLYWTRLI